MSGLEARMKRTTVFSNGTLTLGTNYSLSRSAVAGSGIPNDKTAGKQLIYTPVHHLSAVMSVSHAIFNGGLDLVADSRRFTTSDNSEWLSPAVRLNADIGAYIPLKRTSVKIELSAYNILNADWESVRNYPMPLRSYRIRLIIDILSQHKNGKP